MFRSDGNYSSASFIVTISERTIKKKTTRYSNTREARREEMWKYNNILEDQLFCSFLSAYVSVRVIRE